MTMEDRGLTTAERSTVPEERRTGLRGPVSHALPLFDIVFVAVMLVLLGAFTIGFAVDPTGAQSHVFFLQTKDFFADYFNVCEMSAGLNPYWYGLDDPTPWEHGYPPLCYLIFYVLSGFADYGSLDAFSAGYTTMGMASAVLFMSGLVVLFALLLRQGYRRQGVVGMLMPVALLGSSIVMHSIERGNIILLAADCTLFFVLAYRSEHTVVRELALVALATATALKGYPALVGMLLLFDRRYLAALRCALYALALIFLPFLCFTGGFGNIPIWLDNIALNSRVYAEGVPTFGLGLFSMPAYAQGDSGTFIAVKGALNAANTIVCVAALLSCAFLKKRWKQVLLLVLVVACLPANSSTYLGLYLFAGIVLFFDGEHETRDWAYLACFVVVLNPFQMIMANGLNLTCCLMGVAADLMLVMLTAESCVAGARWIMYRTSAKSAVFVNMR